jgi:Type IV secretion-system coupling protein DNA-binding domain
MFNRLLEFLLTRLINGAQDRRDNRATKSTTPATSTSEAVLLGETIPDANVPGRASAGEPILLSSQTRLRHLYAIGGTGSGKTNCLMNLVSHDIQMGRALCLFDLRGDMVDRVLLQLAAQETPTTIGKRLVIIDLRRSAEGEGIVGINPLAYHGSSDPYAHAMHLLGIFRKNAESWGVQLEETLRNCLIALSLTGWTLLEIDPLLSNAAFRQEVMQGVTDSHVRSFFARYDALPLDQQNTWRLAVMNKITPLLAVPHLRRLLGQRIPTVDLATMLDTVPGAIVLIALAVDRLQESAHLLGGLLLSSLESAILGRVDIPEEKRVPVHLYVDEFENMAGDRFASIIAEGRRFGLGLTLSHQNLAQLPATLRDVIRNNVATQLLFSTGAVDASELSKEVVSPQLKREDIKNLLMTQGVGEAFLVRRGQEAVRIRTPYMADPKVSVDRVQAIRQAAMTAYGRSLAVVDKEIEDRENLHQQHQEPQKAGVPSAPSKPSRAPVATASKTAPKQSTSTPKQAALPSSNPPVAPTYEIRHAKLRNFKRGKEVPEAGSEKETGGESE